MNEISLKLTERTQIGGKKAAQLLHEGFIPSVIYGGQDEPRSTQSPVVETTKVARAAGKHTPVHLTIGTKKALAIIKSIDVDPVKHTIRHVAFHTVNKNDTIVTEVPLVLTGIGESPAERAGLVVLQAIEKIEVKAIPANLPESLEISIVELATNEDKITLEDITLPSGVEFADNEQDMSLVIANVYEPSALQAANDAAGGDAQDESEVLAENGGDTAQDSQSGEAQPGGKGQDEPKQSNVDANKK
jgi:large subunit ribosomal protein L25